MEYIHCPLCEADDTKFLFTRKDFTHRVSDVEFIVVRCKKCGMVYLNPRPDQEEIHSYYPEEFYEITSKEELLRIKEQSLQAKYEMVKHIETGELLDVGCNKGEFLFFMHEKGWRVRGVEFSSKPPNVFNQNIFYGELEAAHFNDNSFDLVTLWAVLEHVNDPLGTLREINRILVPGGTLVALVTNFNSIPGRFLRHDDIPRHMNMFTRKTMSKMLQVAGLKASAFSFNQDIFDGSVRGMLNYLTKLSFGEKLASIVEQNRSRDRWYEFSSTLNGTESEFMKRIDALDMRITPFLNGVLDFLHLGFIMIVEAKKETT